MILLNKVYLAGPMRGLPNFNFPAFYAAADALKAIGIRVINPAELDEAYAFDPNVDEVTPELVRNCVRRDVDSICQVDAVILLPGWENSKGARAEVAVAEWLGVPVYKLSDIIPEEVAA